jgi:hypothetical protein
MQNRLIANEDRRSAYGEAVAGFSLGPEQEFAKHEERRRGADRSRGSGSKSDGTPWDQAATEQAGFPSLEEVYANAAGDG